MWYNEKAIVHQQMRTKSTHAPQANQIIPKKFPQPHNYYLNKVILAKLDKKASLFKKDVALFYFLKSFLLSSHTFKTSAFHGGWSSTKSRPTLRDPESHTFHSAWSATA